MLKFHASLLSSLVMRIADKDATVHKVVFEVRYSYGFVYLDRCGSIMNRIMKAYPQWVPREEAVNPQNAQFIDIESGTHFNFGPVKYDFSLDQPISQEVALTSEDLDRFIEKVDLISRVVHEELELKHFVREGFRIWYLFSVSSENEAQTWISDLSGFSIAQSVASAFDGALESQGHVAIVRAQDRKFRIAMNVVERIGHLDLGSEILRTQPRNLPKGQREAILRQLKTKRRVLANPGVAVMIDVDAFLDEPIDVVPSDFISQSLKMIERQLPIALTGEKR